MALLIFVCTSVIVTLSACGVKGPPMPLYKEVREAPRPSPSPSSVKLKAPVSKPSPALGE